MVTPVTTPSVDQQVQYMSLDTPLAATIVNIWEDGPVDIVVTDPSVPEEFRVTRMVYVPYGGTYTPLDTVNPDPRYVAQLSTGSGLPAAPILNTGVTIGGDGTDGQSTEPLES